MWWRGQDSNLRPAAYEAAELPGCSTRRVGRRRRARAVALPAVPRLRARWQVAFGVVDEQEAALVVGLPRAVRVEAIEVHADRPRRALTRAALIFVQLGLRYGPLAQPAAVPVVSGVSPARRDQRRHPVFAQFVSTHNGTAAAFAASNHIAVLYQESAVSAHSSDATITTHSTPATAASA